MAVVVALLDADEYVVGLLRAADVLIFAQYAVDALGFLNVIGTDGFVGRVLFGGDEVGVLRHVVNVHLRDGGQGQSAFGLAHILDAVAAEHDAPVHFCFAGALGQQLLIVGDGLVEAAAPLCVLALPEQLGKLPIQPGIKIVPQCLNLPGKGGALGSALRAQRFNLLGKPGFLVREAVDAHARSTPFALHGGFRTVNFDFCTAAYAFFQGMEFAGHTVSQPSGSV